MLRTLLVFLMTVSSLPLAAVTVVDDSGREVTLGGPAKRIIALAPHVSEQLFAIGAGDSVVGAVDYSDYPPAAKEVPRVGGYSRLDLEAILALMPDLVVGWESGNDPRHLERLEQLGLTVYRSEPRQLEDIPAAMEKLGQLSGQADSASRQAALFRQTMRRLQKSSANREPLRVFYQIWNRPLMTINGEHLISDVISLCGGKNVFGDLSALTPKVSIEAVLAADPELIVASGMDQSRPEWLDEWRRWGQVEAVTNNQLHFIPPELIQRATPRLLQGAEQLCDMINQAQDKYGP